MILPAQISFLFSMTGNFIVII